MEKVTIFKTNIKVQKLSDMIARDLIPVRIQDSFIKDFLLLKDEAYGETSGNYWLPSPRKLVKSAKKDEKFNDNLIYGSGKTIWTGGEPENLAKILIRKNVKFSVRYLMVPKPKEKK